LITFLLLIVVIGPFARVLTGNPLWSDYGFLSCMDGIAIGCLAAMAGGTLKLSPRVNRAFRIGGSAMCLLITVFRGTAVWIGFYKIGLDVTILQLGTALLVVAMQQRAPAENLLTRLPLLRSMGRLLRWFGRNSYEVYLTHMLVVLPIVMLFQFLHADINTAAAWLVGATAVAGMAGSVTAKFYSEPLNRRLRADMQTTSSPAAVGATAE
jgi:peptidoglycan/LPS O-acetylase OafA/YrhL